ncbi:MAG TPA: glycosyltransferase family 2 protein [Candidatus Saccharimonadales bacterium]|nr:glycosyltransferase family 2 protein [Candidatus Saccharimonadales bacterium]
MQKSVFVVIPNYNGADMLAPAIESVLAQSLHDFKLVIVDNGSRDDSRKIIKKYTAQDERVIAIYREKNYGYTGGVNPGMELAIEQNAAYVAPFNNDAIAHKDWLKHLVAFLDKNPSYGIAACNLLHADGKTYDSTGDQYSIWGLPYPRDRDQPVRTHDDGGNIFGASGGASMYRVSMLQKIGLFDQDFFAYYEDIDLSFRAQLAGWKVRYVPESKVYHKQSVTSNAMPSGFTTYQYMKNLPLVLVKDMPASLLWRVYPRFCLAYLMSFLNALVRSHNGWAALKGAGKSLILTPKKLRERRRIQRDRTVTIQYIWGLFLHDLPPNAHKLRAIRRVWWRLTGKQTS